MNVEDVIQQQKEVGKKLLSTLSALDKFVVIAGGAARDWYLGNTASDLDIYMYYNPEYTDTHLLYHIESVLKGCDESITLTKVGRGVTKDGHSLETLEEMSEALGVRYTHNPNVRLVLQGIKDGVKFEIIVMNTPIVRVSDFCFNICQAWTKDCEVIGYTKVFKQGVEHKVIWTTGEFYSAKDAYVKKIKERFKDWLFVDVAD